jgi:hypothetical protein
MTMRLDIYEQSEVQGEYQWWLDWTSRVAVIESERIRYHEFLLGNNNVMLIIKKILTNT